MLVTRIGRVNAFLRRSATLFGRCRVNEKKSNLIERINVAQQRVTTMFVRQCGYGEQTKRLPNGLAACGQFVGAEAIPQRGLHGISAALRVLGPCPSEECRE